MRYKLIDFPALFIAVALVLLATSGCDWDGDISLGSPSEDNDSGGSEEEEQATSETESDSLNGDSDSAPETEPETHTETKTETETDTGTGTETETGTGTGTETETEIEKPTDDPCCTDSFSDSDTSDKVDWHDLPLKVDVFWPDYRDKFHVPHSLCVYIIPQNRDFTVYTLQTDGAIEGKCNEVNPDFWWNEPSSQAFFDAGVLCDVGENPPVLAAILNHRDDDEFPNPEVDYWGDQQMFVPFDVEKKEALWAPIKLDTLFPPPSFDPDDDND
ncbi:MAG: hypothetical protein JXR76_13800 [Deltaproteobacteria bacterium]|nr:hypothetical protein [Deltaproteobacteria bacterium]